jgi:hypothetical protein
VSAPLVAGNMLYVLTRDGRLSAYAAGGER